MAMTITYKVKNGIYVNMTNRCPCACTFCLRQTMDHVGNSGGLWLEHEPTPDEIKDANVVMTVIDGEIVYEA